MTTKNNIRECASCAKRRGKDCAVLVERIGEYVECWSWTDNRNWEAEVEEATLRYAESRGEAGIRELEELVQERSTDIDGASRKRGRPRKDLAVAAVPVV